MSEASGTGVFAAIGGMVRGLVGDLAGAFRLLTRLPIPGSGSGAAPPARCFWAFPPVGAVVGLGGAIIYALALRLRLDPSLAAILAIVALVLLTGGFHEDGLADTADGFGGGRSRERRLEIMRDSRIGSYGALALILSLALRIGALTEIHEPRFVALALILAGTLARGGILIAAATLVPARNDGMAAGAGRPPRIAVLAGLILALGLDFVLLPWAAALIALAAAILASLVMILLMRARIGGYSGDTFGALEQVAECAVLVALAAYLG